jgi:type VI secretion system protein ImpK
MTETDDPFAEPGDTNATLLLPRPGGVAAASRPTPATAAVTAPALAPAPVRSRRVQQPEFVPTVRANALIAAAAPLLVAAARIGRGRAPDPDQLRRSMVEAVREFETRAVATGLDTHSLRAARYALCATIDDLVLSTPWGSSSSWVTRSLTSSFHNEVTGGERFFGILEQMQKDPGRHAEVIELMYLCASLGFEGRYRVLGRGGAALTELRDGLYRGIRQRRGEFERELSPQWRGIDTGGRRLGWRVPLWLIGLGTLAAVCVIYLAFNLALAGASDIAFGEFAALPPHGPVKVARAAAVAPPPPPPAAPAVAGANPARPSLHQFLQPEIAAGLVQVLEDPQSVTVRLVNRTMFASGSAELNPSAMPLLTRIGQAVRDEPGNVLVNGYTDNQPIRTVRFPSNWQLSQARAEAVAKVLAAQLPTDRPVSAAGKGDADPLAPNTSADGRERNRRTEIVLLRTSRLP